MDLGVRFYYVGLQLKSPQCSLLPLDNVLAWHPRPLTAGVTSAPPRWTIAPFPLGEFDQNHLLSLTLRLLMCQGGRDNILYGGSVGGSTEPLDEKMHHLYT